MTNLEMNLRTKLDNAIKAQSTPEQWQQYKNALVASEDNMNYFKKVLMHNSRQIAKTFGVPKKMLNKEKPMRYKVTSDRTPFKKGTEFVLDENISGILFDTDQSTYPAIGKDMLRNYPEDFEPIPEVAEGQYWAWKDALCEPNVFRIQEVYQETKRADVKYLNGVEKQWYINGITDDARKLSTDEIEKALIKEAKRRIGNGKKLRDARYKGSGEYDWESPRGDIFYVENEDALSDNIGYIYYQGEFAEIIDQTPDIEINGYKAEFHDGYVKTGCRTNPTSWFKDIISLARKNEIRLHREGEDITDKILQIADYYEKQ